MAKNAFTQKCPKFVGAIISDCYSLQLDKDRPHPVYETCKAIWDTGAHMSVISMDLARKLGLKPMGYAKMLHANGDSLVNTTFVNILLPNKIEIQMLQVMESNLQDADMLIGMDVINLCDFAITHTEDKTLFSFDIPSNHQTDYTKI